MNPIENQITQNQYRLSGAAFTIAAAASLTLCATATALHVGALPIVAAAITSIGLPVAPIAIILLVTFSLLTGIFIGLAVHNIAKAELYHTHIKENGILLEHLLDINTETQNEILKAYHEGRSIENFVVKERKTSQDAKFFCKASLSVAKLIKNLELPHLVVPKVTIIDKNLIIQEKLPLPPNDIKYQLGLYQAHPDVFDQAITEFTHFCCYIEDITIFTDPLYEKIFNLPSEILPRFDILPLYIEDGIGKIGLINLTEKFIFNFKRFPQLNENPTKKSCEKALKLALTFFSDHEALIRETCNAIFERSADKDLDKRLEDRRLCEKKVYQDHMDFIDEHPHILHFTELEMNQLESVIGEENFLIFSQLIHEFQAMWEEDSEREIENNTHLLNEPFEEPFARTFFYKIDSQMIPLFKLLVEAKKIFLFEPLPGKKGEYLIFA